MRFSQALAHFEEGALIARLRWNRDIKEGEKENISFVCLEKRYQTSTPNAMIDSTFFEDQDMEMLNHPIRKNRGNKISVWIPTIEDMCSRDWYIVNFNDSDWSAICGYIARRRHFNQQKQNEVVQQSNEETPSNSPE